MAEEKDKGTEGLETKRETKREDKGKEKGGKKKSGHLKDGMKLKEIRVRIHDDGTFGMEHHHETSDGHRHHHTPEYSAATIDDLHDHMDDHAAPAAAAAAEPDPEEGADPAAQQGAGDPSQGAGDPNAGGMPGQ